MEQKTKIDTEDGKQELVITREFDLPLELLFKAYTEPEIVAQWMSTMVLKLESKKHGSYQFETTDAKGNNYCTQPDTGYCKQIKITCITWKNKIIYWEDFEINLGNCTPDTSIQQ